MSSIEDDSKLFLTSAIFSNIETLKSNSFLFPVYLIAQVSSEYFRF